MQDLQQFISQRIPESIKNFPGFLEIIRKQGHENINSSIYAFFINVPESNVRELFLDSLLEIIHQKSNKKFTFASPLAQTEVSTEKGRVDIVIQDRLSKNTIIIENKLYFWLHNDLEDYWNHFKIKEEEKVGVLLTLEPHGIPLTVKDKFINITHLEWLTKIKAKGFSNEIPLNYKVYITDFIKTIENLSKSYQMNEQAKFYFENAQKVKKVHETLLSGQEFLNNQLQLIADKIGWQTYGNTLDWKNFWDEKNHLDTYLTIITKPILNGELKFTLILELKRDDRAKKEKLIELLKENAQFKAMKRGNDVKDYVHFGSIDYTITIEQLENFADFVVSKIRTDFADVTLKAIREFYPNKDISEWEEKFLLE